MTEPAKQRKKPTHRSPEYPALALEKAIERATAFYKQEGLNYAARDVAMRHWGYGPKSSGGMRTLAALIHYGLLEEKGAGNDRRFRISELGKQIILDDRPNSLEREGAIREAALNPKIYRKLWDLWGPKLPSDTNMRYSLKMDLEFNPSVVDSFIKGFKDTNEFAKLGPSDILSDTIDDNSNENDPPQTGIPDTEQSSKMPTTETASAKKPWDLIVPLSDGQAILRAPIPLSQSDYQLLTTFLQSALQSLEQTITVRKVENREEDLSEEEDD